MKFISLILFLLCIFEVRNSEISSPSFLEILRRPTRSTEESVSNEPFPWSRILVFVGFFVLLVASVSIVFLLREYRRLSRYAELESETFPEDVASRANRNKIHYGDYKDTFEIELSKLSGFDESLGIYGEGNFGKVLKGQLEHVSTGEVMNVAIKVAHPEPEKQKLLFKEILVMCAITKHANILPLVGAVTINKRNRMIVTEAAHSDMKAYLTNNEYIFTDLIEKNEMNEKTGKYLMEKFEISDELNKLSTFDLILFAYQIANGMQHLASIPCVHRDLALRNVLIMSNKTIRIGDFGLARRHEQTKEYYYGKHKYQQLPTLRMAPESFAEEKYHNRFTEKSDVWPFALTLYELFTLGKSPTDLSNDLPRFFKEGGILSEPKNCLSEIYEFMRFCWHHNPGSRPTFKMCTYIFECQLKKFPNEAFDKVKDKLSSELLKQENLKNWVQSDLD